MIMLQLWLAAAVWANQPKLNCVLVLGGETHPLTYVEGTNAYHSHLENLPVTIVEKNEPGRYEIRIMQFVKDALYDKLLQLVAGKTDFKDLLTLGQTRTIRAYVGLYDNILHFEQYLGTDRHFQISCVKQGAGSPSRTADRQ